MVRITFIVYMPADFTCMYFSNDSKDDDNFRPRSSYSSINTAPCVIIMKSNINIVCIKYQNHDYI